MIPVIVPAIPPDLTTSNCVSKEDKALKRHLTLSPPPDVGDKKTCVSHIEDEKILSSVIPKLVIHTQQTSSKCLLSLVNPNIWKLLKPILI